MKKQIALLIVLAVAVSSALVAGPVDSSKEVTTTQAPPENPWRFTLTPYGWMSGINGTISAGDRSADIDVAFKDVLKHLDMGVMMAAEVGYKRWSVMGDLIYARLSDDIDPPRGIAFSSTHEGTEGNNRHHHAELSCRRFENDFPRRVRRGSDI